MERLLLATAIATVAVLTGCGSQPAGSAVSTTGPASTATAKARAALTACVDKAGLMQLLTSSGRESVYSCFDNIVPPAARPAFRNCVVSAAVSDKIWTSGGRAAFLDADGPDCVTAALS